MRLIMITVSLVCCVLFVGLASVDSCPLPLKTLELDHMTGSLLINIDRIRSIYFVDHEDPGAVYIKINYDGNPQGKAVKGPAAKSVWDTLRQDKTVSGQFLWVSHLKGKLGIPVQDIQSAFYQSEQGKAARLRIIYDSDTKVIDGEEAAAIWKKLTE